MLLVAALGAALTVVLFTAIVFSRKLCTGSGIFIAVSTRLEAFISSIAIPFFTAAFWISLYPSPSSNMCRAVYGLLYLSRYAFHWSMVPTAANRLVAICFPRNYSLWVSRGFVLCALLLPWTIAICCMGAMISDPVTTSLPVRHAG